ncbi:hypothetical protein [Microbacterium sp. 69-10]|uniref:hypothetical protein n=1 Tax=Microbacterium sp. 69-10 TaxID=1895783 RepID=UPI0025FFFC19|nr:hypothetical protein [Microbacterium sp. 69-10]
MAIWVMVGATMLTSAIAVASPASARVYIPDYALWDYVGTSYDANNSATSIYNHGVSETAYMYAGDHHSGLLFSIPKGNYNWWLPAGQNDNIESGYYASYN